MKNSKLFLSISIGINILLLIIIINVMNQTNELEVKSSDYENTILKLEGFEERLDALEKEDNSDLQQRIRSIENQNDKLEDLILHLNNVDIIYGTIKGIEKNENIVFKIKVYDPIKDEYGDELISLQASNDCKPYFYSEIGLVEADMEDLVEKVDTETKENYEDDYTFVIIENEVVHIYQGMLD